MERSKFKAAESMEKSKSSLLAGRQKFEAVEEMKEGKGSSSGHTPSYQSHASSGSSLNNGNGGHQNGVASETSVLEQACDTVEGRGTVVKNVPALKKRKLFAMNKDLVTECCISNGNVTECLSEVNTSYSRDDDVINSNSVASDEVKGYTTGTTSQDSVKAVRFKVQANPHATNQVVSAATATGGFKVQDDMHSSNNGASTCGATQDKGTHSEKRKKWQSKTREVSISVGGTCGDHTLVTKTISGSLECLLDAVDTELPSGRRERVNSITRSSSLHALYSLDVGENTTPSSDYTDASNCDKSSCTSFSSCGTSSSNCYIDMSERSPVHNGEKEACLVANGRVQPPLLRVELPEKKGTASNGCRERCSVISDDDSCTSTSSRESTRM